MLMMFVVPGWSKDRDERHARVELSERREMRRPEKMLLLLWEYAGTS